MEDNLFSVRRTDWPLIGGHRQEVARAFQRVKAETSFPTNLTRWNACHFGCDCGGRMNAG
jgi:hypothetical protein